MLKGEVRTKAYMNAILQNKHLFKDKVVRCARLPCAPVANACERERARTLSSCTRG